MRIAFVDCGFNIAKLLEPIASWPSPAIVVPVPWLQFGPIDGELMRLRSVPLLVLVVGVLAISTTFAQQNVDTLITRGRILTADDNITVVEELAITGGRIVARGTSQDIAKLAGPTTRVIDVRGATVIPGLIDNHFHLTRAVATWHQQARFEGVGSRKEALAILAAKAASQPAGEWVMVQGGWTPRQFADAPGGFTLEELDRVAPKNPLFVQEGYNAVYCNTLALTAVGLDPAGAGRLHARRTRPRGAEEPAV